MDQPVIYICPMHPEIESYRLGRCLKCGMKLVPKGEIAKNSVDHSTQDLGLALNKYQYFHIMKMDWKGILLKEGNNG